MKNVEHTPIFKLFDGNAAQFLSELSSTGIDGCRIGSSEHGTAENHQRTFGSIENLERESLRE